MNSRPLPTRLSHVPSQSQAVTLFFFREVELSRGEKLFPALFWYLNPVSKTKLFGFPFLRHKRIHQNPELAKRWMDICDGNVTTAHGSAQHCLQWHPAITHAQNFFHNQAKAPISRCTIFLRRGSSTFPRSYFFLFHFFAPLSNSGGPQPAEALSTLILPVLLYYLSFFLFFFPAKPISTLNALPSSERRSLFWPQNFHSQLTLIAHRAHHTPSREQIVRESS